MVTERLIVGGKYHDNRGAANLGSDDCGRKLNPNTTTESFDMS